MYAEAESLYRLALPMLGKRIWFRDPEDCRSLKDCATLLRKIDRNDDAASLEARAEAILKKQLLKVQGK